MIRMIRPILFVIFILLSLSANYASQECDVKLFQQRIFEIVSNPKLSSYSILEFDNDKCKNSLELVNSKYEYGMTVLSLAAYRHNDKLVGRLLQMGADPNLCDEDLLCPLHHAQFNVNELKNINSYQSTVNLLLNYGGKINAKSSSGKTVANVLIDRLVGGNFWGIWPFDRVNRVDRVDCLKFLVKDKKAMIQIKGVEMMKSSRVEKFIYDHLNIFYDDDTDYLVHTPSTYYVLSDDYVLSDVVSDKLCKNPANDLRSCYRSNMEKHSIDFAWDSTLWVFNSLNYDIPRSAQDIIEVCLMTRHIVEAGIVVEKVSETGIMFEEFVSMGAQLYQDDKTQKMFEAVSKCFIPCGSLDY